MSEFEVAQVVEQLRKNVLLVKFTKVDGSKRTMRCTLMPEHLPPPSEAKTTRRREKAAGQVVAYDLDKKGFRSFLVSNVESIEYGG
jgi:hypothetical protein